MDFKEFGKVGSPSLLLIPGLGVSYEIFLPLIHLLEDRFHVVAAQIDGFTLGEHTKFTSVDDQAAQVISFVKSSFAGSLDCAYGLSLGGKILSMILEMGLPFALFRRPAGRMPKGLSLRRRPRCAGRI